MGIALFKRGQIREINKRRYILSYVTTFEHTTNFLFSLKSFKCVLLKQGTSEIRYWIYMLNTKLGKMY